MRAKAQYGRSRHGCDSPSIQQRRRGRKVRRLGLVERKDAGGGSTPSPSGASAPPGGARGAHRGPGPCVHREKAHTTRARPRQGFPLFPDSGPRHSLAELFVSLPADELSGMIFGASSRFMASRRTRAVGLSGAPRCSTALPAPALERRRITRPSGGKTSSRGPGSTSWLKDRSSAPVAGEGGDSRSWTQPPGCALLPPPPAVGPLTVHAQGAQPTRGDPPVTAQADPTMLECRRPCGQQPHCGAPEKGGALPTVQRIQPRGGAEAHTGVPLVSDPPRGAGDRPPPPFSYPCSATPATTTSSSSRDG